MYDATQFCSFLLSNIHHACTITQRPFSRCLLNRLFTRYFLIFARDPSIMDQAASDISISSANNCSTPTSTIMTDAIFADEKDAVIPIAAALHVEHHPVANRSSIIRTRQKPHRYLTLDHGHLKLLESITAGGGWLWHCFKNCGWYGFRNTVSGTHLGHAWWDDRHRLHANAPHHRSDEYFIADRQTDGGYTLLA